MAKLAQEVFTTNWLADKITLVPGHSTGVSVLENPDSLISELIGNDLLEECVLSNTQDAIKRL